jgi:hypothetical protein
MYFPGDSKWRLLFLQQLSLNLDMKGVRMYNQGMNNQKDSMIFKIRPAKLGWVNKVAYPVCKKAKKFCESVTKCNLLPEELKAMELAGFKIDYEETPAMKEPFYTRGII